MKNHIKNFLAVFLAVFFLTVPAESYAFWPIILGAAASAATAYFALKLTLVVAFKIFAVQVLGGLLISALSPKPRIPNLNDLTSFPIMSNHRSPISSQIWIYGQCRVGGVVVYEEATDDNDTLWRIIALAGHEVESIGDVYLFNERVTINTDIDDDDYELYEVTAPEKWAGKARIWKYTGTDTQNVGETVTLQNEDNDDVEIEGLTAASASKWTSAHKLQGIACLVCKFEFDIDAWPNGIPIVTADVKGRKVFDPRDSTTTYSNNWALVVRDFLTQHPQLASTINDIDDERVKTAANICDQQITAATGDQARYTIDGAITIADTNIKVVLENMARAGAGDIWIEGGKWNILPGYLPATKKAISNFIAPLRVGSSVGRSDRFNKVRGTFRGPQTKWQESDFPEISSSVFLAADNGVSSVIDINLPFVTNSARAQRIAKIILYRMREELIVNCKVNLEGFDLSIGDVVSITYSRFGWTDKLFQVRNWEYTIEEGQELAVDLTLKEISADIFAWSNADEKTFLDNNTDLLSPYAVQSTGFTTEQSIRILNQEVFAVLEINITVSQPSQVAFYEVEMRQPVNTGEWIQIGSGPSTRFHWHVFDATYADIRTRAVNYFGVKGEWHTRLNVAIDILATPPDNVSGFSYGGTGDFLHLYWDGVSNLDLSHYEIRFVSGTTLSENFNTAEVVIAKVARPATATSLPFRSGTYFIVAVDKLGNRSSRAANIFVPETLAELLEVKTEHPPFQSGTFSTTRLQEVGGVLKFTSYPSNASFPYSATWTSPTFDYGSVRTAPVEPKIEWLIDILSPITWDDLSGLWDFQVGNWDALGTEQIQQEGTGVTIQFRYTQDNPNSNPTWTNWENFTQCVCEARAFQYRLILSSSSRRVTPAVSNFDFVAKLPLISAADRNVSSGTTTKRITFEHSFFKAPTILITPHNLGAYNYFRLTSISGTGFTIAFYNQSNSIINRTFDWTAYGAR